MPRVLIVDDHEENLLCLRAVLGGAGFDVDCAHHGVEALALARGTPPDLIVSDLLMPVMDGYTLLRHWKADARLAAIPFIVHSATYTATEDQQLALDLGAAAFILKPAQSDAFLARVREVQERAGAPSTTTPAALADEHALLKVYSETLIRKLEEKTLQLEEMNRTLQRDLAHRRRVEEELRESEERFRATFEHAAVGIAHIAPDGAFLRVNDKLCEITHYARAELLQRTFLDLTVPEDRADSENALRTLLAGGSQGFHLEKRYQRRDGSIYWVQVVTTLLRGPAGEPRYFISVTTDVTERKQLEDQVFRAQRMESIGTLAGGIAHDLNNLLAPIVMGVSLLKQNYVDEENLRLIDTIERSAQRGTDLVKRVLLFARGAEGGRVAVNLGQLARELQGFVNNTFPKSISFECELEPELWPMVGDATQINQVLLNLCVNARDAMPEGGRLALKIGNIEVDEQYAVMNRGATAGRYVVIEVSDTGTGIPREIIARIFEPFFTTKDPGQGSGLGLSTALGIVRLHGGFVNVESEPGRGSSFRVYFPAKGSEAASAHASRPAALTPPRGGGELVMVVDDEASILDITKQTLQAFGYQVVTAKDGAQAIGLYALHREEIAVVITDMMMPVMDGKTLIAALRRLNPAVLVIATSGYNATVQAGRSGVDGADYFIPKPFSAEAMLMALSRTLAARAGQGRG